MKRSLGLLDMVLMSVVAVVSLRWTAAAASNGPGSLTLWALAALLFLVPQGLAVAHLSSRYPDEGGLYRWTQRAFGDGNAFFCGWCYWVNNLLYFPSLLLFVAANVAFVVQRLRPEWQIEHSKEFVVAVTLGALWLVAGASFVGMRAGKWIQNAGAIGNWIPGILVAILGAVAVSRFGSANPITVESLVPNWSDPTQLSFFAQICFALTGLELLSFFGNEFRDPKRTMTRGVLFASCLILFIYVAGTLGILASVPKEKITLVNGILLPIEEAGKRFDMAWLVVVCAGLIAMGGVGQTMAWFAGAARVPYLVGVDRYLPASFSRTHPRFETPHVALLWQAIIATLFTLFATAGASTGLETAYRTMVDMCLILYFIPYCYLFLSVTKIGWKEREPVPGAYRIPGGRVGLALAGGAGFATTGLAIATSLVPPGQAFDTTACLRTLAGTAVMLTVGAAFYWRIPQLVTGLLRIRAGSFASDRRMSSRSGHRR